LHERQSTGRGQKIISALFETAVYLVGQHMAQMAVTGQAAKPMPARLSAWAIYDVFDTLDGQQVFVGVVSDAQWQSFCTAFGCPELSTDPRYTTNNQRVLARSELLPLVRDKLAVLSRAELLARLERAGLPFAPIARPEDLFEDPHLQRSGGLTATQLPDGRQTQLPALPLELDSRRPTRGGALPAAGEQSLEVLRSLGIGDGEVAELAASGVIELLPEEP
jgi:crotonobetainyl-CoA:carnitine CoA-transferase CaiB-like acyl-CoA transferase